MKILFRISMQLILLIFGAMLMLTFSIQGCSNNEDDDDCDDTSVVYKPNIYLYPETATQLQVTLNFPMGGSVIASEPDYGNGWDVWVEPSGLINQTYGFLFYESTQPNVWQQSKGWVIEKDNLLDFFTSNLSGYGFNTDEINDFTEYWIPILTEYPYYVIYPQEIGIINSVIELSVSETPDNILRLFYYIVGKETMPSVIPSSPAAPSQFLRNGFVVTEWGVII